ncbi:hypothetical protein CTAYLR_009445 [Chrysophaeum taylorii]|uniref:C2H2-type domain-containing protein n=1 Tax=Chrysophaeum taylorii TaxID=2483200 RepID=A0AAD7U7F1_9STRA|nr:hypothetical protein CTAYLR_009445 [Chrysophaeum taylorii]
MAADDDDDDLLLLLAEESSTSSSSSESKKEEESAAERSSSSSESSESPRIKLGLVPSMLSVVPFTPYWWEARRAFEAANNLRRMRAETVRARELVRLCENGQYVEALREHGEDVDLSEYGYFNQVKETMRRSGKWKWHEPRDLARPQTAEGRRCSMMKYEATLRRIKRDFARGPEVYTPLHEDSNWGRLIRTTTTTGFRVEEETQRKRDGRCRWTGEDPKSGARLACRNPRLEHPTRKVTDVHGAVVPDLLKFCAYHAEVCVGAHETRVQAITTPNDRALCNRCHVRAAGKPPPPKVTKVAVPGVYVVANNDSFLLVRRRNNINNEEAAPLGCASLPPPRKSVLDELRERSPLPTSHHLAPRAADARFFFSDCRRSSSPSSSSSRWKQKKMTRARRRLAATTTTTLRLSRRRATMIPRVVAVQTWYRGHRARFEARRKRCAVEARRRAAAAAHIQAAARRANASVAARGEARTKLVAVDSVQRLVRGFLCRRRRSRLVAALALQKAGRCLRKNMIFSSVLELQKRRRAKRVERRAELVLNRAFLAAVGRLKYAAARRASDRLSDAQRRVAARVRGVLARLASTRSNRVKERAVAAAAVLQAIWRQKTTRREFLALVARRGTARALLVRVFRGALGRSRARRIRARIDAAWRDLVGPTTLRSTLENLLPKAKYASLSVRRGKPIANPTPPPPTRFCASSDAAFFEKYDCAGRLSRFEFRNAARALWHDKGLVIQEPVELEPFVKMFDEFSDGNVNWQKFLAFASLATKPCSRHRRIACAACAARGPCERSGCGCDAFVKGKTLKDLVCDRCGHSPFSHALVPSCCVDPEITTTSVEDVFTNRSLVPDDDDDDDDKTVGLLQFQKRPPPPRTKAAPTRRRDNNDGMIRDEGHQSRSSPDTARLRSSRDALSSSSFPAKKKKKTGDAASQEVVEKSGPVVAFIDEGGEFRWTVDVSAHYVDLVMRLSKNNDDVTQLVFRNDVFFERHWKKIVRDIRAGKLDRHIPLRNREAIEARMYPRPDQAARLEKALKGLGFHARSANQYHLRRRVARKTRPFVCPHPGCGQCFSNRSVCEHHSRTEHANRRRLAVATPDQDQYLSRSWPRHLPWRAALETRVDEDLAFECPICSLRVRSTVGLRRHLAIGHRKPALRACLAAMREKTKPADPPPPRVLCRSWNARVEGPSVVMSPPFRPPRHAPVAICLRHDKSSFRCVDCARARRLKGPIAPLRFGREVVVSHDAGGGEVVDLKFGVRSERAPLVVDSDQRLRPAQLFAVCEDVAGRVWIAVAFMRSYRDVDEQILPATFDRQNEMLEDSIVAYVRAERIAGHCYTLFCSRDEFHLRRRQNALPSHPNAQYVKFATRVFDSRRRRLGPRRVLDTDADDRCHHDGYRIDPAT